MGNRVVVGGTEIAGIYLLSGKANTTHAMVGETLSADQFHCEVNTADGPFIPADQETPLVTADEHFYYAKNPIDVTAFQDGDEVFCYSDENLIGKFYFEELIQTGANRYRISAVSLIGRLLDSKHYGGIYVQVPAATILADILDGIRYSIDPEVAAATVSGYLPIASRRDNLQQLLAVTGATVKIDSAGAIDISAMSDVSTGIFDGARCYENGSVTTTKNVTGVKVTEHNYFPAGNVVTLFEDGLDGTEVIEFSEPYHDLAIVGGTIVESGANYAKIAAKGAVTLTGQPYTHVTRMVTAGTVDGNSTENVKSVSTCYLANPQVAQSIANRMYSFLACNTTISQDVLLGTERAGDVVSVINPYTAEMQTATIKKMDITLSGINKASAEFLVSFTPQGSLSGFKHHALLTGSGTWAVPEGVTQIRIIVVGAGSGGGGGEDGEAGTAGNWSTNDGYTPGKGGRGGKAGSAGSGGKIFEISLDVTEKQKFRFSCGVAGVGGSANGGEGTAGTDSSFGNYSSSYGRLYPYGYAEAKTGFTFGASGADGRNGGAGGDAAETYEDAAGEDGESVGAYSGGKGLESKISVSGVTWLSAYYYCGGGGGGAANGANGGDASDYGIYLHGGDGATGTVGKDAANYGAGGGAGNGGAGGGGGGARRVINRIDSNNPSSPSYDKGSGGSAGYGTAGGNGGNGCIVVYY